MILGSFDVQGLFRVSDLSTSDSIVKFNSKNTHAYSVGIVAVVYGVKKCDFFLRNTCTK